MASDSKTEQATPRRRLKAREKGQVVRSRELVAGLATMASAVLLSSQLSSFPRAWRLLLRQSLETACSPENGILSARGTLDAFRGVAITLGLTWILASIAALAQGGLVFAPSALAPNWSRISPASRLEQLFSLTAISRLLKSLLPAAAVVYLTVSALQRDWSVLPGLLHRGIAGLFRFLLADAFEVTWKSALVLLIWSGVDYLLERRKFESDLRMSRQDIVDEFKETEGNPTVKARIRRLQRQVRRRRMLKDVERAAVVITNPTEFAIALEFGPLTPAPIVVAKGRNLLAAEIKQVARWHGIPLVENPPLAHALYRAVEIGQSIPPKLYRVVAEVLAAIYRAQSRAAVISGHPEGATRA
jgi:flagellar biosynthesis protein FlhB